MKLKKIVPALLFLLIFPVVAFAQEAEATKSTIHIFYEKTFGPIGAIAGFIAIIVMWQMSKKVEKNFAFTLKIFAMVLFLINIASIVFGIHSVGILDGETSRYIERTFRLSALLLADVAALMLLTKLSRKKEPKPENQKNENN